jgi:hypothetical protein
MCTMSDDWPAYAAVLPALLTLSGIALTETACHNQALSTHRPELPAIRREDDDGYVQGWRRAVRTGASGLEAVREHTSEERHRGLP